MLEIYACTALIVAAAVLVGGAILAAIGRPGSDWLGPAVGLATLIVVAALTIRLPGRAPTAAIVLGVVLVAASVVLWRRRPALATAEIATGVAVAALVTALATLPFVLNERTGVLGEGIYTNDHAAQLYWADWLQTGFGPEPSAVRFGYPIGPQALAAAVGDVTGIDLISIFNGLMLAIAALTGLTALAALDSMPPLRRIAIASLAGLPYLAASFLAQSAFKETAMALFVLAFALVLARFGGLGWRGTVVCGILLAGASVFTFSIPGLAWFCLGFLLWFGAETLAGRDLVNWGALRETLSRHRVAVGVAVVVAAAALALAAGPAVNFAERINDVQESRGRLSSPVSWGEVFGIWPEGDFRIVRGEVPGSLLAIAVGALAALYGLYRLVRGREWALAAMVVAGGVIYVGARLFAQIHVEAKALAIVAPLVLLVSLRALLWPWRAEERRGPRIARHLVGAGVFVAALLSTLLALRAAPVGFDDRSSALERLAERAKGGSVLFLGVDRFAGYRLRDTLARAPAGYVPQEIAGRPGKFWQQGDAADFDSIEPRRLDEFDYAITTSAAYQSAPPSNFEPVLEAGDYVLWRRVGETPPSRILEENAAPGVNEPCVEGAEEPEGDEEAPVVEGDEETRRRIDPAAIDPSARRSAIASVFEVMPVVNDRSEYDRPPRVERAAGDQEDAFLAPATATAELQLPEPGAYELSLQYHSQVPIEVAVDGEVVAELPPSLDGMYLAGAGHGAFWPAGEFETESDAVTVELRAQPPSDLQDALGVERRVWLGTLAATSAEDPVERRVSRLCGNYIDHFRYDRPLIADEARTP